MLTSITMFALILTSGSVELQLIEFMGFVYTFEVSKEQRERIRNWDKTLQTGNMILLSRSGFKPNGDMVVGSIVRREPPRAGGAGNKMIQKQVELLQIDGLFDVIVDVGNIMSDSYCGVSILALESSAFFVPYHRTLEALRTFTPQTMPLMKCILGADSTAQYLRRQPLLDVGSALKLDTADVVMNVLEDAEWGRCAAWSPELEQVLSSKLDADKGAGRPAMHAVDTTQARALKNIFTHNVAIVQGTPGTGKTFVGAKFAQILLENFKQLNLGGPILCVCFTNHAIDAELVLGREKNLNVSLMERLVRIQAPFVTLTTQRRMHPDISHFTKDYYRRICGPGDVSVEVEDHQRTRILPAPVDVKNEMRVVFISNPAATADQREYEMQDTQSKCNLYEAELVVTIAGYLAAKNSNASITILLPYLGQVKTVLQFAVKQHLEVRSKTSST